MQALDMKLDAAINKMNGHTEDDDIVDMSPKHLTKISRQMSIVRGGENHVMQEMDAIKQRHDDAQVEIDEYKQRLDDKHKELEEAKKALIGLQATGRKMNEQMRKGK